jgi:ubiquitin C-terminal hydrolase
LSIPEFLNLEVHPDEFLRFDIIGVAVHLGDYNEVGHFVTYLRHVGGWYEYNDSIVKKVSLEYVRNIAERNAVLFLFHRVNQ